MQGSGFDGDRHRAPPPLQRLPQRRDGAGYDPGSGDAFASAADGTLTVIHEDSPNSYRVVQTIQTPEGSRNIGLDSTTHRVFVVSAKFGPAAGSRRPPVLPGTFALMVIERK